MFHIFICKIILANIINHEVLFRFSVHVHDNINKDADYLQKNKASSKDLSLFSAFLVFEKSILQIFDFLI